MSSSNVVVILSCNKKAGDEMTPWVQSLLIVTIGFLVLCAIMGFAPNFKK